MTRIWPFGLAAALLALLAAAPAHADDACAGGLRKISVASASAPPNVVHTTPFVAKALGFFAKHCVDADIVQFEGGLSQTMVAAIARGEVIGTVDEVAASSGAGLEQVWAMAPHMPQAYVVQADIETAADLKGKRLNAAGGGVGGFNWRMGRALLQSAGLTVDDAQFIPGAMSGRLPGLVAGQIDGVALHPEDVYLAQQQKPGVHVLVKLADLLPELTFNTYGASRELIARDPTLVRDVMAAMIEANRAIYREEATVLPIMADATKKPQNAVEFAYKYLTDNCIWSVNTGITRARTEWTIKYDKDNGDIQAATLPAFDQVVDLDLANQAVAAAGGPATIGACKE